MIVGGPCLADRDDAHNNNPSEGQGYSEVLHRTVRAFYDELEVGFTSPQTVDIRIRKIVLICVIASPRRTGCTRPCLQH